MLLSSRGARVLKVCPWFLLVRSEQSLYPKTHVKWCLVSFLCSNQYHLYGYMSLTWFCLWQSDLGWLPPKGDLVAIDAEFVCVQPEQSLMLSSGSKEITSEARNALARLSIINCQTNETIIDDYVLPMEPVVDYLTRFSGIRPNDLDVNTSPHHLVTPHEAYLKVRLLMERYVNSLFTTEQQSELSWDLMFFYSLQWLHFCWSWFESRFSCDQYLHSTESNHWYCWDLSSTESTLHIIAVSN